MSAVNRVTAFWRHNIAPIVAILNDQFLTTSVDMLTTFAMKVDAKLERCNVRIQKMEAALVLVEKKLGGFHFELGFRFLASFDQLRPG